MNLGVHQEDIDVIGFEKVMNNSITNIYISGPVTGVSDYKERFQKATDIINNIDGFNPINPMSMLVDDPDNYYSNMKICTALLGLSDAICMLPGWKESKGAHYELGYAVGKGLKVYELKEGELVNVGKAIFGQSSSQVDEAH
jgi:hypothetical protein